jgi:TonB family protein
MAHGDLKPSNILAVEDTVKLSSDTVSAGDPAADIRALGVVLVQALRSSAIDALPFPFREAVQNCRFAGEIVAWLRSPERTARNTIHGKATVVVGVAVDASGSVAKATLEPGGSPYFGALALEAARHWQFAAVKGAGPRNWTLRFEIAPAETQVIPVRAGGAF